MIHWHEKFLPPVEQRELATRCDRLADAAEADGDHARASMWRREASERRDLARQKEIE